MRFVIVVVQFVAAWLLGFGGAMFLGVGNGWELVVIPLGMTLGVWGVGVAGEEATGRHSSRRRRLLQLVSTASGSAIGVVLIVVTPAFGIAQLLLPLLGALLGFYLGPGARAPRAKPGASSPASPS